MKLGINLSHEASVAVTDESGVVIFAIEEERLSRQKGDNSFPINSLLAVSKLGLSESISEIIIGNSELQDIRDAVRFKMTVENFINPTSLNPKYNWSPKFKIPDSFLDLNPQLEIQNLILKLIYGSSRKSGITPKRNFSWVKHHNGHLGCGIGVVSNDPSLIVSLDGEGDWESGAVALLVDRKILERKILATHLDSLGHLYSCVTSHYGFKKSRHEGKITGLAAYGEYSGAVEILTQAIQIENGTIKLKYVKNNEKAKLLAILKRLGFVKKLYTSMDDIVNAALNDSPMYPDLAFAIQTVLEKSVCEIIEYWAKKWQVNSVALSGGIFANVKLNQKISELPSINRVSIFPNMGDGGLSLGGVWWQLSQRNQLNDGTLFDSMYLSNNLFEKSNLSLEFPGTTYSELKQNELVNLICDCIENGQVIGLHQNGVEFGPRALGNRSILFDPRRQDLGKKLNSRLKRTEFMPFAPVILEKYFHDFMSTNNNSLQPFNYMTMTCTVKVEVRQKLAAVTHVDGTARPQLVNANSNPLLFEILTCFMSRTGIPALVNTSLNMHEEPINGYLEDSIQTLLRGGIDILVTKKGFYKVTGSV